LKKSETESCRDSRGRGKLSQLKVPVRTGLPIFLRWGLIPEKNELPLMEGLKQIQY
jgi:hypothetical protein